jgi:hypothetical protein
LTMIGLGDWKKYLEEYGVTEGQFQMKVEELNHRREYQDIQKEAVWRLIYDINVTAHHTHDDTLMERTYRTMAVMTYDKGEDPKNMVELSMQYRLIQLDNESMCRTRYDSVEVVPGCPYCFGGKQTFDLSTARALIPVPCKRCQNRVDEDHPFGLCECTWQPNLE